MTLNASLRQMRYFVAVAEDLHFGRASERMHVVQPAISQQIRALESELGLELFDRRLRKVALTDAGKAYLAEIRRGLQQIDLAAQAARDAAHGLTGHLSIGFVDNALWSPLPRVVREFGTRFPGVNLSLLQMSRTDQVAGLVSREIDVAILPGPIENGQLRLQTLAREPVYVVLPSGHRLCAQASVAMNELARETFIAIPAADNPRRINEIILALCGDAGFVPRFGQPVQQLHTAISLVSAGLGVAIIPRWMCQARSLDLEYRPISPRSDYILLVGTAVDHERPATKTFLAIADEIVAAEGSRND